MIAHLLLLWLHLAAAVVLVGLALYWVILRLALARLIQEPAAVAALLRAAHAARWPHRVIPWRLRLPVPLLSLLCTLLLVATGLLLGAAAVEPGLWRGKLALTALLLLVQFVFVRRPADWAIFAQLPLALLLIALSALAVRS